MASKLLLGRPIKTQRSIFPYWKSPEQISSNLDLNFFIWPNRIAPTGHNMEIQGLIQVYILLGLRMRKI